MRNKASKKFKKGDEVVVIAGKDKGKKGKILQILAKKNKVIVSGVNLAVVHKKPTANTPGQRVKIEKAIDLSNVAHVEGGKPVRVGFKIVKGDKKKVKKERISRKTKKKIG